VRGELDLQVRSVSELRPWPWCVAREGGPLGVHGPRGGERPTDQAVLEHECMYERGDMGEEQMRESLQEPFGHEPRGRR
jgi:hypothetical protein